MTDDALGREQVVEIVRAHLESLFPRNCSKCKRLFASLLDYLSNTTHLDAPISLDDDSPILPESPVGTLSLANCACGTTLSLGSDGIPTPTMLRLMGWARAEKDRRGIDIRVLLTELRDEIDRLTFGRQ